MLPRAPTLKQRQSLHQRQSLNQNQRQSQPEPEPEHQHHLRLECVGLACPSFLFTPAGMLHDPILLDCIEDKLTVGGLCRLRRVSKQTQHTIDGDAFRWRRLSRRMGWYRPSSSYRNTVDKMLGSRRRCRECGCNNGRPCFNGYALCRQCHSSEYFHLVDRRYVTTYTRVLRYIARTYGLQTHSLRAVLRSLLPARRTRAGFGFKRLYWKHDLDTLHITGMRSMNNI